MIWALLLVAVNILMALHHHDLIESGKKIKHGIWGGLYLAISVTIAILLKSWLFFIDAILIRKVVFDLALNAFRGLPLFYVSSSTTSILDKFHNKVFGKNSKPYMLFYFISAVVITIFL